MSEAHPATSGTESLRTTLIDAAAALLAQSEAASLSLREVARRAGVSHNAPYRHFRDKAELLAAVAAAGYDRLRLTVERAAAGAPDAAEGLTALIGAFVAFALEDRSRYALMIGKDVKNPDGSLSPELRSAADRARHVLRDLLIRGGRSGIFSIDVDDEDDVSAAVVTVWSTLHGYTLLELDRLRQLETTLEIDQLTKHVAMRLVTGLRPRRAPVSG
jgi:AcrR family transcriptional regulator